MKKLAIFIALLLVFTVVAKKDKEAKKAKEPKTDDSSKKEKESNDEIKVKTNPCQPTQVHIALSDAYTDAATPESSSIKVVFHTEELCKNANIVLHDPAGDKVISYTSVEQFNATYKKGDYSTVVYVFDLPNLKVNEIYNYTCFGGEKSDQVGPFSVHVPNPKPENKTTTVVMIGDWDTSELGQLTFNKLTEVLEKNKTEISALVHMGDFAYDLESQAGKRGDKFMEAIQPIAANIPYMVFAGNHETNFNFSNMNMRFKMPNFNNTQNHLYSFNLGNIHFVVYDVELLEVQPELLNITVAWLAEDLKQANANRAERPWIVVTTHRPLYCSKKHEDCMTSATRYPTIEDVIYDNKVDLFISGHVHYYERMFPIRRYGLADYEKVPGDVNNNYIKNAKAPVYILQGIAGHDDYPNHKKAAKPKEFAAYIDTTYSINTIKAFNSTHMLVENIHSETGFVSDFMYLIKDAPAPQLVEA